MFLSALARTNGKHGEHGERYFDTTHYINFMKTVYDNLKNEIEMPSENDLGAIANTWNIRNESDLVETMKQCKGKPLWVYLVQKTLIGDFTYWEFTQIFFPYTGGDAIGIAGAIDHDHISWRLIIYNGGRFTSREITRS